MSTRIRVFISSTMRDLANERHEVVRRVRSFNFEPVNAESWLPHGTRTWERIEKEIESSHLFVLILGDSYGFIPDEGPGAGPGLSATHLEARRARELGLPVLTFVKRLGYDAPRDTDDARRRDEFRREVMSWAGGLSAAEFELAADLADKVGAALVEVLSETFLADAVRGRAETARAAERQVGVSERVELPVFLPPDLVERAADGDLILFAGAGVSLAAGYPSQRAMIELITSHLRRSFNDETLDLSGKSFQEIAGNIEAAFGRRYLLDIFLHAMSPPQGVSPTAAHVLGVCLFKTIITTNFDALFEAACDAQGIEYQVVGRSPELDAAPQEVTRIFKLSGTLTDPQSLRITEQDVRRALGHTPAIWDRLLGMVRASPVVFAGSSLRDESIKMMFADAPAGALGGFIVSPYINSFERLLYERLRLRPVDATADDFFRALAEAVGTVPPPA